MPNTPGLPDLNFADLSARCEKGKSSMTQEALRKLRDEVKAGSLNEDPNHYNHAETPLKPEDTVASILKEIFAKDNLPQSVIDRIELQMQANGLNLNTLITRDKVAGWKVESGRLVFLSNQNGVKEGKFFINVLPWTALSNPEVLSEDLHNYDLGVYEGAPALKGDPQLLEGSADLTAHQVKDRDPKWYKNKTIAAFTLMDWYKNAPHVFDPATQALIKTYEPLLQELSAQTNFNAADFRRAFEQRHGGDEIFGGKGVYNFVLAFQRILDKFGPDKANYPVELIQGGADYMISIKIGPTVDKADERYVKAKTKNITPEEPPIICKPEPEPGPKPPEPNPPEKPPTPDEIKEEIEKLENDKFKISTKAIYEVGFLKRNKEMTSGTVEVGGKTYNTFYIIDKANPLNPPRFIAFSPAEPDKVHVGNINYDRGLLSTTATPGPFTQTIALDTSSPAATRQSIRELLTKI